MDEWFEWVIPITSLIATCIAITTVIILIKQFKQTENAYTSSKNTTQIDILMKFQNKIEEKNMMDITAIIAENKPILEENGGVEGEYNLVKYLAIFEALNNHLELRVLEIKNVYAFFANHVKFLAKNSEVSNYVKKIREKQHSNSWDGVYSLVQKFDDYSKKHNFPKKDPDVLD